MNDNHFGMPGPGGSLGTCAVCGKPFLSEVLLGKRPVSFQIAQSPQTFHAHKKCEPTLRACKQFLDLPPESPLRQAWEKEAAETPKT